MPLNLRRGFVREAELLLEHRLWHRPDGGSRRLAVLEQDQRRDRHHAVALRDRRLLVDVELHDLEVAALGCDLVEHGRDRVARPAPLGPEVDEHRLAGAEHLVLEGLFGDVVWHWVLSTSGVGLSKRASRNLCSRSVRSKRMKETFTPLPNVPDHPALERELLERWDQERTFDRLREQNRGNPRWSFIDGPITANNPMGVHHAWGRALKDVFQRYKALRGFDERYQNGFDCQGLWVEVEVEKELGLNSKREIEDYGIAEFAERCKERVAKFVGVMTEQSKRLGQWMDWGNDYLTFSDTNIEYIWRFLAETHRRGWLYKGHRSTQWCPRCGTSLSQHEQAGEGNHVEMGHPSPYVRFPLKGREGQSIVVWTTTPWTLPANIAAAVKPDADYELP